MKKIILMSFIWILIFGRKMDIFHLNYGIYLKLLFSEKEIIVYFLNLSNYKK